MSIDYVHHDFHTDMKEVMASGLKGDAAATVIAGMLIYRGLVDVAKALENVAENVRSDHPLMGSRMPDIEAGLISVADAIRSVGEG